MCRATDGAAFCAAPVSGSVSTGTEPRRERPRPRRATCVPRAPIRGRSRLGSACPSLVLVRGACMDSSRNVARCVSRHAGARVLNTQNERGGGRDRSGVSPGVRTRATGLASGVSEARSYRRSACHRVLSSSRIAALKVDRMPDAPMSILHERWLASRLPSVGTPARWTTRAGDPASVGASRP